LKVFDIIIVNGSIMDPTQNMACTMDIGIIDGKIEAVGDLKNVKALKTINAKGYTVTPGLIDFHTHIAPLADIGIPAEAVCFSSGVTTVVDAGSCGVMNFEKNIAFIQNSKVTIKALINMSPTGLKTDGGGENIDPALYDAVALEKLCAKYPDIIWGLKIRYTKDTVKEMGLRPLEQSVEIARKLELPLAIHCTGSPVGIGELVNKLERNDVLVHCYHNIGNTIIGSDGKVLPSVWEARNRGVIFDAANARFHFAFKTALAAIEQGFLPDIISTDLTMKSLYRLPQMFNINYLMSKYLAMGIPFMQILERCITNPAKLLKIDKNVGSIQIGYKADLAIFKMDSRKIHFEDWENGKREGNTFIDTMLTIKSGEIVYQDFEYQEVTFQ